jgi:Acetyltransferase (isoleucine patch superfamily)
MQTDLSKFRTNGYYPGARWKILLWYLINYFILDSAFPWPYTIKRKLLRLFGAKVGQGVIIKTKVRIKYPWKFKVGNHSWIGESVWIDNLEDVNIGSNVALSQGAMLLTGNHDYSDEAFSYRLGKIVIEDGVWVGARSIVCPGVICKTHSVLTVASIATRDLEKWSIYSGNPAVFVRHRHIRSKTERADAPITLN